MDDSRYEIDLDPHWGQSYRKVFTVSVPQSLEFHKPRNVFTAWELFGPFLVIGVLAYLLYSGQSVEAFIYGAVGAWFLGYAYGNWKEEEAWQAWVGTELFRALTQSYPQEGVHWTGRFAIRKKPVPPSDENSLPS